MVDLPAKNTQNQVEHEEWSYNNQRDKEDPVEHTSKGIIGLKIQMRMVSFHLRLEYIISNLKVKAKSTPPQEGFEFFGEVRLNVIPFWNLHRKWGSLMYLSKSIIAVLGS